MSRMILVLMLQLIGEVTVAQKNNQQNQSFNYDTDMDSQQEGAGFQGQQDRGNGVQQQSQAENLPRTKVITGNQELADEQDQEFEEAQVADATTIRRFHEVLNELLNEFGYDLKLGQIKGLKNISLRKMDLSTTLPRSYKHYLEMLIAEQVRENSRVRIISCLPCKSKTSRMVDGRLVITSPTTNSLEMTRVANQLGIDYFMDAVLVYHTTHMVLGLQIFNVDSKELVWSRSYNSETIRSRFQKLAVDYSQVEKGEKSDEYVPDFRYSVGLGGAGIPNVGGSTKDSSFMALSFRGSEKFNNRKTEFGVLFNILQSSSALLSDYPVEEATVEQEVDATPPEIVLETDQPKAFTTALVIFAVYSHNFLGSLENYDRMRHGINFGIGTILASGYLAGAGRLGWDIYFGKRFILSLGGIAVNSSEITVGDTTLKTKGGGGGDVVISYNF